MSTKRRLMYCALAMVLLLSCIGIYSHCQRKPVTESVERDTVVVYDTIPHYYPKPVAEEHERYVTRYLPVVKTDTIFRENSASFRENSATDSVAVVVPITQKHYRALEYDAWVSGYEANLDSIKVYRQREFITEVRTISKPPNKWELDLIGGLNYNTARQDFTPYAGGEILYKPSRLQIGLHGGIVKGDRVEPYVGTKIKIRVF